MDGQNGNWMDDHPQVQFTPYADREIRKAKDDYSRSVASGQFDEIQLEELRGKTDAYIHRLMQSSSEEAPTPARDTLQQKFNEQVIDVGGSLLQHDPASGRFEVLTEPVKDERQIEEMQFQQKLDTEKGRIDLMKQLASVSTGNAEGGQRPMYTPDQIRAEVDKLLPSTNENPDQESVTPEQFDKQWATLKSGETLTGPDGKTYRKR